MSSVVRTRPGLYDCFSEVSRRLDSNYQHRRIAAMADAQELSRITTSAQLDDLLNAASMRPVWLFKHSLICPTSARAWHEFEKFAAKQSDRSHIGVIEIQRSREISREVEVRTGVRHQSPQALLIRGGLAVWHASHWSITERALDEAAQSNLAAETSGTTSNSA